MNSKATEKKENAIIKAIKEFKWGYILMAVLLLAIGLCFVLFGGASLDTAAIAVGAVVVIISVVFAFTAFADKSRGASFFIKITVSIVLLVCGVASIIARNGAIEAIIATLGLIIIMDGAFKLNTAAVSSRNRVWIWWLLLVISVILIAGGFITVRYLRADTENVAIYLGALLLLDGVANVLSPFMLGSIERHDKSALRQSIIDELSKAEKNEEAEGDKEASEEAGQKESKEAPDEEPLAENSASQDADNEESTDSDGERAPENEQPESEDSGNAAATDHEKAEYTSDHERDE